MADGLGINRRGNAILCQACGESDRTEACLAKSLEEVKGFIVDAWTGDIESPEAIAAIERLASHDWDDEHSIVWEFEIGGVSMEDVCDTRNYFCGD